VATSVSITPEVGNPGPESWISHSHRAEDHDIPKPYLLTLTPDSPGIPTES
jgi:hypothetical protein